MKFIYNEALTKNIVENYFKVQEDIDGELHIKCGLRTIPPIGRSLVAHEYPTIEFLLKGSMEVDGEMQPVEIPLSESEVENAFTTMMDSTGRKVKRVSINYDEHQLNSVMVEASAKRKVKR